MFVNRLPWYLALCAFWFATAFKWFLILSLMPGQVNAIVPPDQKNSYWGMIVAIGALEACVGPALMGMWSDRVRKRLIFLIVGAVLTGVAAMMLANATTILALTVGYLLLQIADDVATGPYSALIPQLVPSAYRTRAAGVMATYQALANLIGAACLTLFGQSFGGFMVGLLVLTLVCAAVVMFAVRRDPPFNPPSGIKVGPFDIWQNINFRWVWFTRFLVATGAGILVTYGVNFLNDRVDVYRFYFLRLEDATRAAGLLIVAMALTSILGAALGARLGERMDRRRIARTAGLLMAASMIPFGFITSFEMIVWIAFAYGFGNGMYASTDWALAADVLPDPTHYGRDMGIWQSSIAIPQLFGGGVGVLIDSVNRWQAGSGYVTAFGLSALLFVVSSVFVMRVQLPAQEEPQPAASR